VKACMFVAGPHKGDSARTRPVYLKDGRKLLGYIFEPYGKGAGYKYKKLGRNHASVKCFSTIRLAKEGLGSIL
jgi:hypothetical protein